MNRVDQWLITVDGENYVDYGVGEVVRDPLEYKRSGVQSALSGYVPSGQRYGEELYKKVPFYRPYTQEELDERLVRKTELGRDQRRPGESYSAQEIRKAI